MDNCAICGKEVKEDEIIVEKEKGKTRNVCKRCATGIKGMR